MTPHSVTAAVIADLSTARERLLHLSVPADARAPHSQALCHLSIAVESLQRITTDNPSKEN